MIRAIERAAPIHEPGTRTGYHGLTYGYLVGEILQRVTGSSFSQLVRQEIAAPLGLDGMYVGAPRASCRAPRKLIWPSAQLIGRTLPLRPGGTPAPRRAGGARRALAQRLLRLVGIQLDLAEHARRAGAARHHAFDFGAEETLRAAIPAANGLFTARVAGPHVRGAGRRRRDRRGAAALAAHAGARHARCRTRRRAAGW